MNKPKTDKQGWWKKKEKTDLEKLATYLWGLIPYHKMAHNKQVPVQECPDCLSLVGAKLDYNPSKEEGGRANIR